MQFLVDEGCDALIVRTLRQLGHDVSYIAEIAIGSTDDSVLTLAFNEKRILVTEDRDFCELVFRDNKLTHGIVLVRIPDEHRIKKVGRIKELLDAHIDHLPGAMTTLSLYSIRIRSLGQLPGEE